MTVAVCHSCGEIKHGALVPCPACGVMPKSPEDMAYAIAMTDHYQPVDALKEISDEMKTGHPRPLLTEQDLAQLMPAAKMHAERMKHIFATVEAKKGMSELACEVTDKMGLDRDDPAASELVKMIVQGVQQHVQMQSGVGEPLSDQANVLMSVATMTGNRSAYERLLAKDFHAVDLLKRARAAGRQICVDIGDTSTIERLYDRMPEISHEVFMSKKPPKEALYHAMKEEGIGRAKWWHWALLFAVVALVYWVDQLGDKYVYAWRTGAQFSMAAGLAFGTFLLSLIGMAVWKFFSPKALRSRISRVTLLMMLFTLTTLAGKHYHYTHGPKASINMDQEYSRYRAAFKRAVREKRVLVVTTTRDNADAFARNTGRPLQRNLMLLAHVTAGIMGGEAEANIFGHMRKSLAAQLYRSFPHDAAYRGEYGPDAPNNL